MTENRKYLLDTNTLIDFLNEVPSVVNHILEIGTHFSSHLISSSFHTTSAATLTVRSHR